MNYYKITTLHDLTNEVWVDAFGLEGDYMVSNYGRIKSVERHIETKSGQNRLIPTMIRKQIEVYRGKGDSRHINSLAVNINHTTYTMSRLVYQSFNRTAVFKENEVVMHLNKVTTDNRILNLMKVSKSVSKSVDLVLSGPTKLGMTVSIKTLSKNRNKRSKTLAKRKTKTCSVCGVTDKVSNFKVGRSQCHDCLSKKSKAYDKKRRNREKTT